MSATNRTAKTLEYVVRGMTCSQCVQSVREEVSEISGVGAVEVELPSLRLTVTGVEVDVRALRAAVADAGYEVIA